MLGSAVDVVLNGGFDDVDAGKTVGWSSVPEHYRFVDGAGRSGTRALVFENDDTSYYSFPKQAIACESGRVYRYSAWIKTEGLSGTESGASVCVEWCGADGKWLGGAYAEGVKGTVREWTKVEGVTGAIPAEAKSVFVHPYVRRGMCGKAWFDDVSVVPYAETPVLGLCSSAYRHAAFAGSVSLKAVLDCASIGCGLSELRGTFEFTNAAGVIERRAAESLSATEASLTLPVSSLCRGRNDIVFNLVHRDGNPLGQARICFTRLASADERRVRFDAQGRTLVEGRLFFPLGMYLQDVTDEAMLDLFAKGPFNCLMPYGAPDRGGLDRCLAKGLKVIYSLKDVYCGSRWCPKEVRTEADEVVYVKDRVARYKDHPAVLAWYLNDERPLTMLPRLTARRDLLESLDPDHPCWTVVYQYDQIREYLPSFDVIGTDPYPIPTSPVSMVAKWTRATNRGTLGFKPMWQVPQAFGWGGWDGRKVKRAPTKEEMRSMAWQCIACGANGLVFYSFFDLYRKPCGVPFETRWREVCEVAEEIRAKIPVLLSDEVRDEVRSSKEAVVVRAWRQRDDVHLLAVNTEDETCSVELAAAGRLRMVSLGPLEVRFEKWK